jgi:hypothetical protein
MSNPNFIPALAEVEFFYTIGITSLDRGSRYYKKPLLQDMNNTDSRLLLIETYISPEAKQRVFFRFVSEAQLESPILDIIPEVTDEDVDEIRKVIYQSMKDAIFDEYINPELSNNEIAWILDDNEAIYVRHAHKMVARGLGFSWSQTCVDVFQEAVEANLIDVSRGLSEDDIREQARLLEQSVREMGFYINGNDEFDDFRTPLYDFVKDEGWAKAEDGDEEEEV